MFEIVGNKIYEKNKVTTLGFKYGITTFDRFFLFFIYIMLYLFIFYYYYYFE